MGWKGVKLKHGGAETNLSEAAQHSRGKGPVVLVTLPTPTGVSAVGPDRGLWHGGGASVKVETPSSAALHWPTDARCRPAPLLIARPPTHYSPQPCPPYTYTVLSAQIPPLSGPNHPLPHPKEPAPSTHLELGGFHAQDKKGWHLAPGCTCPGGMMGGG